MNRYIRKSSTLRLVEFLVIILGMAACETSSSKVNQHAQKNAPKFQRVHVDGDVHRNGIFDVSLEYGDDGIGWMAYSSIEIPKFVETHIAKSVDGGKTWVFTAKLNTSYEAKIEVNGKKLDGVWRYETPSILFDPSDKPDRRWKLFTNRYPVLKPFSPTNRRMSDGTIEVQYASSPEGGWSQPSCLAGLSKGCLINVSKMHPSLSDVRFITEPGIIEEKGVIYMSLDAGTTENGLGNWEQYRVILLASKDHGKNWYYAGTLLNHSDAMRFNYLVFTGTSLVREKGKLYLFATPSGATNKENRDHDGTMIIELLDINKAKVTRDINGTPILIKRINIEQQSGGLADYDEHNTSGGIMFPQFTFWGLPEVFQIWNTRQTISDSID